MLIIGVVFLEGKTFDFFPIKQGVVQGCTLSTMLFLIYINGLLCEIEKCLGLGVKFSQNTMSGLPFTDDFVGVAETGLALQKLIDIVHNYNKYWHVKKVLLL